MRPHLPPAANLGWSPKNSLAENRIISVAVKNLFICLFFFLMACAVNFCGYCGKLLDTSQFFCKEDIRDGSSNDDVSADYKFIPLLNWNKVRFQM